MNRRVAKLVGPRKFEIVEEPIRALNEDEVLLRVLSCGLCHSEMPAYRGEGHSARRPDGYPYLITDLKYPFEIGHEPFGVIEAAGKAVKDFKPGDRVSGAARGVLASHVITVPVKDPTALIKIPDEVKDPQYCLIEPLTCISNIVRAANPEYGDYVAVIGCGMMGLMSLAGVSRSAAREVFAIDLMDSRLEWARTFGATRTLNPKKGDVAAEIRDLTHGHGVDVVIEISGKLTGLRLACDTVRETSLLGYQGRGKILMPSLYAGNQVMESQLAYQLMYKAPILHSTHPRYSHDYREDQRRGLWGYMSGVLPLNKIITHEFPLEDVAKGFEIMDTGADNYIKGIVVP